MRQKLDPQTGKSGSLGELKLCMLETVANMNGHMQRVNFNIPLETEAGNLFMQEC
jgi:hypothetical protein